MCSDSDFFLTGPEEHVLKNRPVFMKIRETGLDRFHRFLINLNLIFLKFLIFLKNGLSVSVPVYRYYRPVYWF
jgi:hypothetical protein